MALALLVMAVGGCAAPRSASDAEPTAASARPTPTTAPALSGAASAAGVYGGAQANGGATAVPRRSGPVPSAASLMGAAPAEVTDGLGLPRLVRKEGRTQLWQYRTLDCVLDVFIGEDERRASRVMRLEARDRRGATLDGAAGVASCVDQVAARAVAPTS